MPRFNDYRNYTVADNRFYEEYGRADLPYDLEHDVRSLASPGDEVAANGVWVICRPAGLAPLAEHGWKIHVSAVPNQAQRALSLLGDEFRREPFHFKCLRDRKMVVEATSRGWPTGQVGKVITIYPRDADETRAMLARLYPVLAEIEGPYILTDRRYRDSRCLYYRYGQHRGGRGTRPDGSHSAVLRGPDGQEWEDSRQPVYRRPPWTDELFAETRPAGADATRTLHGYRITHALSHGGAGGVYLAERVADGTQVVLKESRPNTAFAPDGSDRHTRLRREFETLTLLADSGVAPRPYELFEAWEHLFLAQEFIDALPLARFIAAMRPRSYVDDEATRVYRDQIDAVVAGVRAAVAACHERGVAFGDLSLTNVFVHPETLRVWLIDFESSQPLDSWTGGELPATPGFMPPPDSAAWLDGRTFDEMGIAAVELAMVSNRNLLRALDDGALVRSTAYAAALLRRPLGDLFARLELPASADDPPELDVIVKESLRFVETVMTVDRTDRVFPADPTVFTTNAWSVAHGVAGVVRALHRLTGTLPPALEGWLDRGDGLDTMPPGLGYGLAGVGWTLLDAGRPEQGRELLDRALAAEPATLPADVATGVAGLGTAALAGWLRTGDDGYRERATRLGDHLIATAVDPGTGLYWPRPDMRRHPNGYAYGSSGVAVFLLYLQRATGEARFGHAARRTLAYELAQLTPRDDGGIWLPGRAGSTTFEPYWEFGGSGFGSALARFCAATGDESLRSTLDLLVRSIVTGLAVNAGLYSGLAGMVNFALDCDHLLGSTPENPYRALAQGITPPILALACEQPEGIAFPGNGLLRFSTDLATGSAGVALALDRLRNGGPDFHYTLDELLGDRRAE
jgi:hypothetical protein